MIEKEELRIGNLVKAHHSNKDWKVVEIDQYGIIVENKPWRSFDFFDGIPLTEEWLVRFGFNKLCDNDYRIGVGTGDGADLSIELLDEEACIVRNHITDGVLNGDFDFAYINPAKYVHQIQNLYHALTGTSLTIHDSIKSK